MVSIAEAGGYRRRDDVIAETTDLLSQQGSPMTSSLYRDLIAGNAVEADQIIGDLKARANHAGLPVPLLSAVWTQWTHLSVYQQNRE